MDEPTLSLTGITQPPQKEIVRIFCKEMSDHADKSLIAQIFHAGFTFRGSLGCLPYRVRAIGQLCR